MLRSCVRALLLNSRISTLLLQHLPLLRIYPIVVYLRMCQYMKISIFVVSVLFMGACYFKSLACTQNGIDLHR